MVFIRASQSRKRKRHQGPESGDDTAGEDTPDTDDYEGNSGEEMVVPTRARAQAARRLDTRVSLSRLDLASAASHGPVTANRTGRQQRRGKWQQPPSRIVALQSYLSYPDLIDL